MNQRYIISSAIGERFSGCNFLFIFRTGYPEKLPVNRRALCVIKEQTEFDKTILQRMVGYVPKHKMQYGVFLAVLCGLIIDNQF